MSPSPPRGGSSRPGGGSCQYFKLALAADLGEQQCRDWSSTPGLDSVRSLNRYVCIMPLPLTKISARRRRNERTKGRNVSQGGRHQDEIQRASHCLARLVAAHGRAERVLESMRCGHGPLQAWHACGRLPARDI